MWEIIGATGVVLTVIAGAYWVGLRQGKTKEQKNDAEDAAEEMAHDAEIASQPFINKPFSGMRGKK